jgi:metal-dependent amidase/aminoacylase/carboxypeptidase family protein
MWALHKRVVACAEGAARSTGCTLSMVENDAAYEPLKRNDALLDTFRANMKALGVTEAPPVIDRLGSSDVGNVSRVIPTIQPLVKIAPDGTPIHSRAFEAAAVTPIARAGLLDAAKAMAMTTADLLGDAELLGRVQGEFGARR